MFNIENYPKSSKILYEEIVEGKTVYPVQYSHYWQRELNVKIDKLEWLKTYIDCHKCTKLRCFYFQVRCNDIMTNAKLFKMKLKDSATCDWCDEKHQDIRHLLWYCKPVNQIWSRLSNWINKK